MNAARQITAATAAALLGLPVAAAVAQSAGEGSASLRERLLLSEAAVRGLTESLAVANGEAELFKRKADDLGTRIEALGIAPAGKEVETLRSRLLSAVRDLRLLQQERDASREQLVRLNESVMELLKKSEGIDAKSRLRVEQELRSSAALIAGRKPVPAADAGLTGGTVVEVKPDLALVVADIGSLQGVKTGMPFQVWRGERQVSTVRVVDVRDSISGAVVQNTTTSSEPIRTGDTLRIDTTR